MARTRTASKRTKSGELAEIAVGDKKLIRTLRERISASLLPGEAPLSGKQLDEIAQVLFGAGRRRLEGEAALLVRSAHDGRRVTQVAVINRDMPFLVDSIAATVAAEGLAIDLMVHPIVPARRDEEGELEALPSDVGPRDRPESMIYLETERADAKTRRRLEQELTATLADVRAAVADWPRMRSLMEQDAARLRDLEGAELLRWLGADMLTLLGHLTRRRDGRREKLLGICRRGTPDLLSDDAYDRAFAWFDSRDEPASGRPLIIKANRLSRVHRRVPLDVFIVPLLEDGRVEALSVHAGIWTSAALATPPDRVPVLRQQQAMLMERHRFQPGSHDAKALVHALTTLPHDLLIGFSDDDLARIATATMSLADRPRPRAAVVMAPLRRHLFAFVWLPRDMLSTAVRLQIQQLLENETGAETLDWSLLVEGGNLAILRYVLDFRGRENDPNVASIDARLQELLRGWTDSVESALAVSEDPGRAAALAARFAPAFPATYRASYGPAEAALDIQRIRRLSGNESDRPLHRDARLHTKPGDPTDRLRLKIYQIGGAMPLSDAVPALENFGFSVLAEVPTDLVGAEHGTIHDFQLSLTPGEEAGRLLDRAEAIEDAICAVLNGKAENDVFNRLVTNSALSAHEADWLRALYRYLRQASMSFTIYTVVDALAAAPQVTQALIRLFRVRHDPAFAGDREAGTADAEGTLRAGLAGVSAINDDRLLRLYWSTIAAIVRTNAFAPAGREALAFKLDPTLIPILPKPVPWREIFVYSQRVEGIHLRSGPVARGGLRWSDRRDDFRTEVLGLMKAQRVKNAVIVPTGAKGGFYPKRLPDPAQDREAWAIEGQESYKLFIRTLLSVTDNIVNGNVVHPEGVVIHDAPDPYFVVAADKGTATFSDTANAIAEEYGFWLGDAFASGGSNGYDHKAMGITARGAWISVQRHFRELGVDVQRESVRVAGCGDMSGDVFGNGMLLSKAIKLVAAFDHRHIFLDPDPDPAKSWAERKRLFRLPRSSWSDYSADLISRGGGVFPRTMKRIPLSAQARKALGIEAEELEPDALIAAILQSPVDLLWFGGIGTYIRASHEVDTQVGDPTNDALRVSADEVRAKAIGEGANLAVTQAARIEFALHGGRINADFIDNSAGVDCSDNEVNIKIALAAAKQAGKLGEKRRVALLREMTDEVAELVLEDNRLQALALSIAEAGGAPAAASHIRLLERLEELGDFDRRTEGLAEGSILARRAAEGHGLTRSELAVLLSNAKLVLQGAIEASELAQDDACTPLLLEDFPPAMRAKFRRQILEHRLRNEIVATVLANKIVNRMGLVHPFELAEEEGASLDQVAAAFVSACALLGMEATWSAIDTAQIPEKARLALFDQAASALRGHMADLLRAGATSLPPSRLIDELAADVGHLIDHVDDLLGDETRAHAEAIARGLLDAGAPGRLAGLIANLFAIDGAIGLARLAKDTGIAPVPLTHAFGRMGEKLGLDWAQSKASVMNPSDPWERLLVAGLARDFQQMRFDFLRSLAGGGRGKDDPLMLVENWTANREVAIRQFRAMIARAKGSSPLAPATVAQIASQARNLLRR